MKLIQWYRDVVHQYVPRPRRPYEYVVNRYYAHKVDPVLTRLADVCGLSPNQVTLLSMAAGIGAAAAIVHGAYVAAGILIQLHHLLDGVDGNLARAKQLCTEFGRKLDIVSDQSVRLSLFGALAWSADVPIWAAVGMMATLYLDVAVVHLFVLPFARRHPLRREAWKQWFMDRGIMPAFDIFLMYMVCSVCLLLKRPDVAVYLVLVMKTIDWVYRLWECGRTAWLTDADWVSP